MRSLLVACCLLLVACGPPPSGSDGRIGVAVSVPPQGWLVERIGGDLVDVRVLVPPGASPHSHRPSDRDLAELRRCRVYFRTGVPAERGGWLERLTASGGPQVVDLRRGLVAIDDDHAHHDHHDHHHHEHDHGVDPHIWLDPAMLRVQAAGIHAVLATLDPDHATDLSQRHAALERDLATLEAELDQRLAPHRGRAFAVYHPAWTRFAAAHGLRQLSVETAGGEPGDAELTALQQELRTAAITTLFVQPQIHGRSAERVAQALGLELRTLDPLAPDPVANLRHVTDELLRSWGQGPATGAPSTE